MLSQNEKQNDRQEIKNITFRKKSDKTIKTKVFNQEKVIDEFDNWYYSHILTHLHFLKFNQLSIFPNKMALKQLSLVISYIE